MNSYSQGDLQRMIRQVSDLYTQTAEATAKELEDASSLSESGGENFKVCRPNATPSITCCSAPPLTWSGAWSQVVIRVRPPLPRELHGYRPFEQAALVDPNQRVMTLSENLQSLSASGAAQSPDNGITYFLAEVHP